MADITCHTHGLQRTAFVCQHLDRVTRKGFHESLETQPGMELGEDEDFEAWCDECEQVRLKYNGWDEESEKFANIKVVCEGCYFEMKKVNI